MKESGIYDFAEEIIEPDLAPALAASKDEGDYFQILQEMQSALGESAIDLFAEESNETQNSASQFPLDDKFESDFESPVEMPSFFAQAGNASDFVEEVLLLPVPESLDDFEAADDSTVEFKNVEELAFDSESIREFESPENFESAIAEALKTTIFENTHSSGAEEIAAENSPLEETAAIVENELPEPLSPAFFVSDDSSSMIEPPIESFVEDSPAIDFEELSALETSRAGSEESDEQIDEPPQEMMLAGEDVEADNAPEPPSFLFTSKEDSSENANFDSAPLPDLHEASAEILNQYIVFRLDEQLFAFPASCIDEIGHPLSVTNLPFVPEWFSGVANLRGDIIAVINLRLLWKKHAAPPETRTKMLVMRSNRENLRVGLLVDGVSEMLPLAAEEIKSSADFSESPFSAYLFGVSRANNQPLLMLDSEQFFNSPEIRQI